MIRKTAGAIATALGLALGVFFTGPATAQPTQGTVRQGETVAHHQMMGDMMKDMSKEMGNMGDMMSRGNLTAEQRKQMSQRMERMSAMMHRMSGLESRPAMKGPEMQKQMDQMRKQMDEMMGDHSMKAPAK